MADDMGLAERTAREIASLLDAPDDAPLPSARTLSRHLRVSRPVVARALRLLAARGLLELGDRRRPRRKTSQARRPPPPPKAKAAERIYADLRERIVSGEFPASAALPKFAFLSAKFRASDHTIREAYAKLVRAGLAHRLGKGFLAGPGHPRWKRLAAAPGHAAVIVVTRKSTSWAGLGEARRTAPFVQAFMDEVRGRGIRLVNVLAEAPPAGRGQGAAWVGKAGLRRALRSIGPGYLGALIAGGRDEVPELGTWVKALAETGRPAVWFDRNDQGLAGAVDSKLFFRCRFSEEALAEAAARYLHDRGHRRAAYLYTERGDWQELRLEWLRKAGARLSPALAVQGAHVNMGVEKWRDPGASGLLEGLEALHRHGPAPCRSALAFFARERERLFASLPRAPRPQAPAGLDAVVAMALAAPAVQSRLSRRAQEALFDLFAGLALLPLIRDPSLTALLVPNDDLARAFHLGWLERLGIRYPKPLSVLSFDASDRHGFFPLTSVDPGFGFLGYQAFHALLGDVPVAAARDRTITARPLLAEGASVADLGRLPLP